ncbi:MAG: hypothetical protein ACPGR8_15445 [Limisphaerales bacterium]
MRFSESEKQAIADSLADKPVLWNHTATETHVATGIGFNQLAAVSPASGVVGRVHNAWVSDDGAGRAVVEVSGAIGALVGTLAAPAVSLSHGTNGDGVVQPVELSLVNTPARAGAVVEAMLPTPSSITAYKGAHPAMRTHDIMNAEAAATSTPEPTPLEAAVASIPDEAQRNALKQRMEEMAKAAMDANKTSDELRSELVEAKRQNETDAHTTKEAIDMWVQSLGPEIADRWRVGAMAKNAANSWSPQAVRHMVCASADKIRQLEGGNNAAPAAKRARQSAPEAPTAETSAPVSDPLRAALASTFEMGSRA